VVPPEGPFAVIESDPAAFALVHALGAHGLQVIEPHNDHLHSIYHLAFSRRKDNVAHCRRRNHLISTQGRPFRGAWWANRVSNDAYTSMAILNGPLNSGRGTGLPVRGLRVFRNETEIDVFAGMSYIYPFICRLSKPHSRRRRDHRFRRLILFVRCTTLARCVVPHPSTTHPMDRNHLDLLTYVGQQTHSQSRLSGRRNDRTFNEPPC
jgi:hypothetical protein